MSFGTDTLFSIIPDIDFIYSLSGVGFYLECIPVLLRYMYGPLYVTKNTFHLYPYFEKFSDLQPTAVYIASIQSISW